jgi:hypothetical protein
VRALHSTLAAAGLGLCFAAARAPLARDLDVGLPPGSPLEWSASFPVYTPADEPLFPVTRGEEASADETRTVAASRKDADVRFANAFGQVRILTWDLGAHLVWTKAPLPPGTARDELRPPPPGFGEPLYWLSLAPLLRLLLHPDALARSETLAHLVELGEPVLPVLGAAANERALAQACRELSALIPLDRTPLPTAPAGASPRDAMLARFVLEECLRDEPLDPSDDFGRRLYLFAEEAEPLLVAYAQHPSLALARNAVAALGRYRTRTAQEFLASLAARATDPVIVVRALAALGRHPGALEVRPLVARLQRTDEPVQRAALVGALGRSGAQAAAPALLALGETARRERDSDLLISVLSALARISWTRPEPELATFCERIGEEARTLGRAQELEQKPDLPDPPTLRAEILSQLALLAHSQAAPADEEVREAILALARPAPLDARLSELGVGGTDPLGSIPAAVRFLYLEALRRAGPAGLEQLAALVRRSELDTALRARVLALLPADQRDAQALALLDDARNPVELRIAALEVLISDLHPRVWELARAQLVAPAPESAWSSAGEHFLAMRAVRFLSEARRLEARELLPLFPIVQRPPAEREAQVAELREGVSELVAAARDGERAAELRARVAALVDFVIAHHLNTLFDGEGRDARIDLLVESLASARLKEEAERTALAGVLLAQLLGGEADLSWVSFEIRDPGRRLFRPSVPLAEEVLLALGRTREPLALELVLSVLAGGARELRGHACLALAMCGEPAVAEQLLPALLDPEPFVRFAASEALRHLTGKQAGIDWMAAPPAERRAAAEELKRGFLEAR